MHKDERNANLACLAIEPPAEHMRHARVTWLLLAAHSGGFQRMAEIDSGAVHKIELVDRAVTHGVDGDSVIGTSWEQLGTTVHQDERNAGQCTRLSL